MKQKLIRIECANSKLLERQLPNSTCKLNNCVFLIGQSSEQCDYCFILDEVSSTIEIKCPRNNMILLILEPPFVKRYTNRYIKQYGRIATFYKISGVENIPIKIPLLPWMAGAKFDLYSKTWNSDSLLSYDYFKNDKVGAKQDKIVVITSNKAFTKGHKKRLEFVFQLKRELGDKLDIFGAGFHEISDKYEIMSKYKYALVIENCCINNYWTEKLADAYLSECFPFYCGCPNILNYFSSEELVPIDIRQTKVSIDLIKEKMNSNLFDSSHCNIHYAKEKILNKYNLFFQIANFVEHDNFDLRDKFTKNSIHPMRLSLFDKIKQLIYRKIKQ